jgi:hypothetical protein
MSSLHADPPPKIVREPTGVQYITADRLGRGGFAICYRAEQCEGTKPTGKTVALKIVRSKMEPQKLAQKVCLNSTQHQTPVSDLDSLLLSFKYTQSYAIQISSNSSVHFPMNRVHMSF